MGYELSPQLVALSILLAFGLYGGIHFFWPRKHSDATKVNWTPLEAIGVTVAIYFVSQLVAALGIAAVGALTKQGQEAFLKQLDSSSFGQFCFILVVEAITVGLLYWFMKRRKTAWRLIGWVRPKWSDLLYALGGFGVYFLTYGIIVASLVQKYLPVDTEQQQQLGFSNTVVGPELIFVFLSLVILPPLIEEILVRGFLFTGLKTKLSLLPAAVVTSVVFGAAHLQWGSDAPLLWSAAIDTFMLSMVLVYMRHRSGSLWPGIGLHFIKNGIAFLALFVFKVV